MHVMLLTDLKPRRRSAFPATSPLHPGYPAALVAGPQPSALVIMACGAAQVIIVRSSVVRL